MFPKRLPAVALMLALTACGTTVPLTQQTSALGADGLSTPTTPGLGVPLAQDDPDGGSTRGETPASDSPIVSAPAGGPVTSAAPRGSSTSSTGGSPSAVVKPGAPVEIGFFVSKDLGKFLTTIGLTGLSSGNGANQAKTVTALINASGGLGLAGHKIKPVIYQYDPSGSDTDNQAQAACDLFLNDHKAVAVLSQVPFPVLMQCTGKRNVPLVVSLQNTLSAEQFAKNPHVAIPDQPERGRGVRAQVNGLFKQGFFKPSGVETVKVGLLTQANPGYQSVPGDVGGALKSHGISLDAVAQIDTDDGGAQSATSSAVLQFQAKGINRVVFVEDNGALATVFLLSANSQGYYPRNGFSSYDIPQILAVVIPPRSLQGAMAVSWLPTFDVALSESNKNLNAPAKSCMAQATKQGEDVNNSGSRSWALGLCDAGLSLQAAWRGRALSVPDFQTGLRALGSSYTSPMAPFGVDFTSRRDGVTKMRPTAYDTGCSCFRYTGPVFLP